jgi:protein TIF31
MAVGIEVKGILGSDKRMYLLDLLRLSPRDLNYADDALHQCCVLRPELVQNFYVQSAFEKLKGVNEAKEQLSRI